MHGLASGSGVGVIASVDLSVCVGVLYWVL